MTGKRWFVRTMDILHIYQQQVSHDEAYICGTAEGLLALRDTIEKALTSKGWVKSPVVYAADGEGLEVLVVVATPTELGEVWLPYTDEMFEGNKEWMKHPYEVIRKAEQP